MAKIQPHINIYISHFADKFTIFADKQMVVCGGGINSRANVRLWQDLHERFYRMLSVLPIAFQRL